MILKTSTVCTGIGAPEVATDELAHEMGFEHELVFACEKDSFARKSYLENFTPNSMYLDMQTESWAGPKYYSDLITGGIPCQAFSLAGKRLGEKDPRGVLFFDFYRYVKHQQPKAFIIENVKGLLSDNKGKTWQNWRWLLGRSENGQELNFLHPDSLEYNLHYMVLNSKKFGVPQNRERIFLVGIRKDLPNTFKFNKGWRLTKRLKDILEPNVDEKYYLSEKIIAGYIRHKERHLERGNGFAFNPTDGNGVASAVTTKPGSRSTDNYIIEKLGYINQDTQASQVYGIDGISPTVSAYTHGYAGGYIEEPAVLTKERTAYGKQIRKDYEKGNLEAKRSEINQLVPRTDGISNTISTVQKDNLLIEPQLNQIGQLEGGFESANRIYDGNGIARTIKVGGGGHSGWYLFEDEPAPNQKTDVGGGMAYRIRKLTPLETWRLQAFPDSMFYKAQKVNSDTQLFKQAGNSMTTTVVKEGILRNLLPIILNHG